MAYQKAQMLEPGPAGPFTPILHASLQGFTLLPSLPRETSQTDGLIGAGGSQDLAVGREGELEDFPFVRQPDRLPAVPCWRKAALRLWSWPSQ
jgi:hypothetical protein